MKFYRLSILVLLLMALVFPTFAQDITGWFVYLFDNVNNQLVRVYETGDMEIYSLELEDNEFAASTDMAISNDGALLVFCKMTTSETSSQRTLIVRDIANNTNLSETPIDPAYGGCHPSAFSADSSQFVLSLASEAVFDPNTGQLAERDDVMWRVQIIDTQTGAVLNEINSAMPDAPTIEGFWHEGDVPLLADVISFQNDTVVFRGIPYVGTEVPPEMQAWSWNLSSNTVSPVANIGRVNSDYLVQTGELVYPALDEALPAAQPGGPTSQANIVNLQTSEGATQTIYQNSDEVIVATRFVNDGQAIAVLLMTGFDENNPNDMYSTRHILVDRDGNVTEIAGVYEQYSQIAPIPGGAVITWSEWPDGAVPSAKLGIVENGTVREIWSYTPPSDRGYSFLEIVWSPPIEV